MTMPRNSPRAPGAKRTAGAKSPEAALSKEARLAFIRKAQVWRPTDIPTMNIRLGPQGEGAFPPDAVVTCDYIKTKLSGASRKFECRFDEGGTLKVRYGAGNGEVQGSVLASRLLWALGFGADRVYPARVICRGCSPDPWTEHEWQAGEQVFDPAAIERKPEGIEMHHGKHSGWAWPELALIDPAEGGAPASQRDALTLLAVLMQHGDSKPDQQRLLCLPGGLNVDGRCDTPFLILHDVGLTFGRANYSNSHNTASVNFFEWDKTPVWRNAQACTGNLRKSSTGTLGDPTIHEAGRAFLADLLVQLTDQQLHDLFDVARVTLRSRRPDGSVAAAGATVDEWVAAFKHKRTDIVMNHCPH
jgi:hypothetical protein